MARIFLSKADVTELEEEFVRDAVRSGWIAPLGPHVDAFEAEIAQRTGVAGALALSSGTAALHLALLGVGVGPGTVVPVSSMTFAASAIAITYTGARPVFVDSHASDGNVHPDLLLEAVDTLRREGQTVSAVMTVDLFGRCVDYDTVVGALEARGIPLIEDAAEALGSFYKNRPAGSFGRAAALSFNGNKIMTTSGGGMLLSNDLALLERARYLSTQARHPVPWYEHHEVGYNYRLSNILAALGRAQHARLDEMTDRRRTIRHHYIDGLADIPGIRFLGVNDYNESEDNCWLTSMVIDPNELSATPEMVIKTLEGHDIEARHVWKPMHAQPVFSKERAFINGVSDRLFSTGVTLPSGSALSDQDVERVITRTRSAFGRL